MARGAVGGEVSPVVGSDGDRYAHDLDALRCRIGAGHSVVVHHLGISVHLYAFHCDNIVARHRDRDAACLLVDRDVEDALGLPARVAPNDIHVFIRVDDEFSFFILDLHEN